MPRALAGCAMFASRLSLGAIYSSALVAGFLTAPSARAASFTFSHPQAGPHALKSDGAFDYVYDRNGNVVRKDPIPSGQAVRMEYDSTLHIKRQINGGVTHHVYDADGNKLASVLNEGSTYSYVGGVRMLQTSRVEAPHALVDFGDAELNPSGEAQYFVEDHLGSVVALVDRSGIGEVKDPQPYGQQFFRNDGSINNDPHTQFDFNGNELQDGLLDYAARSMEPGSARFLQADTVTGNEGSSADFNRYAYVGNNPTNFADPDGHIRLKNPFRLLGELGERWRMHRLAKENPGVPAHLLSWQQFSENNGVFAFQVLSGGRLSISQSELSTSSWELLTSLPGNVVRKSKTYSNRYEVAPPCIFRKALYDAGYPLLAFTSRQGVNSFSAPTYLRVLQNRGYVMLDSHDWGVHLDTILGDELGREGASDAFNMADLVLDLSEQEFAKELPMFNRDIRDKKHIFQFAASSIDIYFSPGYRRKLTIETDLALALFGNDLAAGFSDRSYDFNHEPTGRAVEWLTQSQNPMAKKVLDTMRVISENHIPSNNAR